MPKKSRRVAVRQAELGQRKRRSHRSGGGAQAAAQSPRGAGQRPYCREPGVGRRSAPEAAGGPAQPAAAHASRNRPEAPPSRRQPPSPCSRAQPLPYMMPELRRIGMIAALMLVILAVLTAVLR